MNDTSEYFLTIDAGTSGVKVGIGSPDGSILKVVKTNWSYTFVDGLEPYGVEFNPQIFWNKIVTTIHDVIKKSEIDAKLISCIAVTSQRHGCVFLDQDGKELYTGPNRDSRGLEVDIDDYIDSDDLYDITGQNPPFLYVPTRFLWFKENDEETFDQIYKILPINSWIVYKLTNKFVVDITTASAMQLIDLKSQNWSEKILEAISLPKKMLPELIPLGASISSVSEDISQLLNINTTTVITLSGADTQSAIVGTGASCSGDVIIVAGSTMPIVQLTDKPIIDPERKIWSGCYFGDQKWIIEANAGTTGSIKDWFADVFLKTRFNQDTNIHEIFDKVASEHNPGSNNVVMDLGIQVFDLNTLTEITFSSISFPSMIYSLDNSVNLGSFCRAVLENIAFAIRANIELLKDISKLPIQNIYIAGGLSRSKLLKEIIANVLDKNVLSIHAEETIIGGFVACNWAKHPEISLNEIKKIQQHQFQITKPTADEVSTYEKFYQKWLSNYKKLRINSEFE